jgi:hypothetical protein
MRRAVVMTGGQSTLLFFRQRSPTLQNCVAWHQGAWQEFSSKIAGMLPAKEGRALGRVRDPAFSPRRTGSFRMAGRDVAAVIMQTTSTNSCGLQGAEHAFCIRF